MKEMYGHVNSVPSKSSQEHLEMAGQFANEMINRYTEIERAEIVKSIRDIFEDALKAELERTQKKFEYLSSINYY